MTLEARGPVTKSTTIPMDFNLTNGEPTRSTTVIVVDFDYIKENRILAQANGMTVIVSVVQAPEQGAPGGTFGEKLPKSGMNQLPCRVVLDLSFGFGQDFHEASVTIPGGGTSFYLPASSLTAKARVTAPILGTPPSGLLEQPNTGDITIVCTCIPGQAGDSEASYTEIRWLESDVPPPPPEPPSGFSFGYIITPANAFTTTDFDVPAAANGDPIGAVIDTGILGGVLSQGTPLKKPTAVYAGGGVAKPSAKYDAAQGSYLVATVGANSMIMAGPQSWAIKAKLDVALTVGQYATIATMSYSISTAHSGGAVYGVLLAGSEPRPAFIVKLGYDSSDTATCVGIMLPDNAQLDTADFTLVINKLDGDPADPASYEAWYRGVQCTVVASSVTFAALPGTVASIGALYTGSAFSFWPGNIGMRYIYPRPLDTTEVQQFIDYADAPYLG